MAYLPPPVRLVDVDVSRPLAPLPGEAPVVRALVRSNGRPIGWITIEQPGPQVSVERLRRELLNQLGWPIQEAALREELVPGRGAPDPTELPPISVVVCSRDRPTSLERCLHSLLELDYPAFEVLVVDNAPSTDATFRLAERLPVRYVREDRPGLDWARNRGIAEARHEIVAFTDDDVRVDGGWLRALAGGFADPDVMLVTGLVAPGELETEAQVIFEYRYGGMGKGLRSWVLRRDELPRDVLIGAHHLGVGANMAFRRPVFDRVGLFDTGLDVGTPSHGGGDLDMFHRVLVSGAAARYEPRALVWHYHRRDLDGLRRQLRDNGRAFGVYLMTQWLAAGRRPGAVPRSSLLRYAVVIWIGWMAGRVVRRLRRREALPLGLQAEEIRGLFQGPGALVATRAHDRRIRRGDGIPPAAEGVPG